MCSPKHLTRHMRLLTILLMWSGEHSLCRHMIILSIPNIQDTLLIGSLISLAALSFAKTLCHFPGLMDGPAHISMLISNICMSRMPCTDTFKLLRSLVIMPTRSGIVNMLELILRI